MAVFSNFKRGWDWLVDGLTEAVLWGQSRSRRQPPFRVELADGTGRIIAPDGPIVGHVADTGEVRFGSPDLARRLPGKTVDIHIPPSWLLRRSLDPVAAQSVPYLDAFVRHQIDRITPWRVADVYYKTVHAPVPGDPTRLLVEIGVVPKRLLRSTLDSLAALAPRQIRLVAHHPPSGAEFQFLLSDQSTARMPALRRWVKISLLGLGAGFAITTALVVWYDGAVRSDIADQDEVIEQRNAVLAASTRRAKANTQVEEALRALRRSQPKTTDILEALSAALPDSAFLTALEIRKDQIQISGVTRALPELVPALETSGHFKDVAFTAASTKLEAGAGDRFHLQLRTSAHDAGAAP